VWVCTDDGPWRSTDDGSTWLERRSNLPTQQFYDICVAQADPLFAMGGTQDNGIPGRNGVDTWFPTAITADGMVCNITPGNSVVYAETQNGIHRKSTTGGTSWFTIMTGITGTGFWVTAVDQDQNLGTPARRRRTALPHHERRTLWNVARTRRAGSRSVDRRERGADCNNRRPRLHRRRRHVIVRHSAHGAEMKITDPSTAARS
jgi:hypothetical protein